MAEEMQRKIHCGNPMGGWSSAIEGDNTGALASLLLLLSPTLGQQLALTVLVAAVGFSREACMSLRCSRRVANSSFVLSLNASLTVPAGYTSLCQSVACRCAILRDSADNQQGFS